MTYHFILNKKYLLRTLIMIAVFKPVNNKHWFDIREFEIVDGKPSTYKWLSIQEHMWMLDKLPVFKPKVYFKNKLDYYNQFKNNDIQTILFDS